MPLCAQPAAKRQRPASKSDPAKPPVPPSPTGSREDVKNRRRGLVCGTTEFSLNRMRQMGRDAGCSSNAAPFPCHMVPLCEQRSRRRPRWRSLLSNRSGAHARERYLCSNPAATLCTWLSRVNPIIVKPSGWEMISEGGGQGYIVIEGHGATLTGCDPLRLDGWVEAGEPGLYKSAKFLSELEEFGDNAKPDASVLSSRRRYAAHGQEQQRRKIPFQSLRPLSNQGVDLRRSG